MINYETLKPFIFKLDPENAHTIIEFLAKFAQNYAPCLLMPFAKKNIVLDQVLEQEIFGLNFFNPIGLGAGFDKNATMIQTLHSLGFGHLELGAITPKPQDGNPKPRIFRHPAYNSIQNAMGFNNDGVLKISERLKKIYPYSIPLGINIGKNKLTAQEDAIGDYEKLVKELSDKIDFFVVNISSPNTPGLRDLQNETFICELFKSLCAITKKPILLKLSPDMPIDNGLLLAGVAIENGASGIVATNTTTDYSLISGAKEQGGLSGEVLKEKSFAFFEELARNFFGKTTLISVGGVDCADEAYRRIKAGASLVQIYTALIFKGPCLVGKINNELASLLKKDGYSNIKDAIGANLK